MQRDSSLQICVRLPNWLGDTVMALGFLYLLRQAYPSAYISVITKKGLEDLVKEIAKVDDVFVFSKHEYKGLRGVWKYGKEIKARRKFDLFFVLPDSFSSALMAYVSGAKKRIGFRAQGRSFLLTDTFQKPIDRHRVEEYASLIQQFEVSVSQMQPIVKLSRARVLQTIAPYIVINTNSESVTSRLPGEKAVELISLAQQRFSLPIKLIGAPKEAPYVEDIICRLPQKNNIENLAGKTSLPDLQKLIQGATLMITSDSGPAHIASAYGIPLVVVTGAGDEKNTGPYHNPQAAAVRNGRLPCEPCVKNYCKLAPLPQCLVQMDMKKAVDAAEMLMNNKYGNRF